MTDCKNCNYTDEYCASGECTSQSPRNHLATTSQVSDLTEQWKKCELPEGDYFISNGDEIYPDYYDSAEGFLKTYNYGVRRVLAEVPDYVEWQNMVNCACEEHKANTKLLEENAQLKERNDSLNNRDINLCRIANGIRDENFALKELLKECRNSLEEQSNVRKLYESDVEYRDRYNNKMDLLIKLDEVLK